MRPVSILFAAALEGATALSIGLLLLQTLRVRLYRGELLPFAYVLGSACLSMTVFLLLSVWLAKTWAFTVVGAAAIGTCLWQRPWRDIIDSASPPGDISSPMRWVFRACFAVYGVYTFIYALAPETSPDGVAYHLGMVGRYFRAGGFEWYTGNMYANLPMGVEMLYLFAYSFGRHSAAALTHWQFFALLPFLLLALGRRFGHATAGAVAGMLVFLSPVVALDGSTAYVNTAGAMATASLFFALVVWEQVRNPRLLVAVGILAGFCYGCKMTGAPAVPFAIAFVAFTLYRSNTWSWRWIAITAGFAALFFAPWMIKNALMVGNPLSPFMNRYFPNPNIRISFEDTYREMYRTYNGAIKSWREIPMEVIINGATLNGFLGPVFLLAPLGLLGLRYPLGRRALLMWACLIVTFPGNIGTRFLIGGLPLLAIAMGLALESWRAIGMIVVVFHALASWPDWTAIYSDPYAWRLDRCRWTQAWRIEPEMGFLARTVPGYQMAREAEAKVPRDGRIFTFGGIAEAYTTRDVAISYQSGRGNVAGEVLATGMSGDMPASVGAQFRFPSKLVTRVRLVQTAKTAQIWSLTELRALNSAGTAYPRQQWWRIRANPNPWDVQFAFDDCAVSRWKAWEPSFPGEFVEIDFIKPVDLGGIRAELSADQPEIRLKVEVDTGNGVWQPIDVQPEMVPLEVPRNTRMIAMDDLRRMGFTHLIVANGEFMAEDVFRNEQAWGLTLLANTGDARLYSLLPLTPKR